MYIWTAPVTNSKCEGLRRTDRILFVKSEPIAGITTTYREPVSSCILIDTQRVVFQAQAHGLADPQDSLRTSTITEVCYSGLLCLGNRIQQTVFALY